MSSSDSGFSLRIRCDGSLTSVLSRRNRDGISEHSVQASRSSNVAREEAPEEVPERPSVQQGRESVAQPVRASQGAASSDPATSVRVGSKDIADDNKLIIPLKIAEPFLDSAPALSKGSVRLNFFCPVCVTSQTMIDVGTAKAFSSYEDYREHFKRAHLEILRKSLVILEPIVRHAELEVFDGLPPEGSVREEDLYENHNARSSSAVWQDFMLIRKYPNAVYCKRCKSTLSRPPRGNTSNLVSHTTSCIKKQSKAQALGQLSILPLLEKKLSSNLLFLKMFVFNSLPFRFASWKTVRQWLGSLGVSASAIPCATVVRDRIMKLMKALIEDVSFTNCHSEHGLKRGNNVDA